MPTIIKSLLINSLQATVIGMLIPLTANGQEVDTNIVADDTLSNSTQVNRNDNTIEITGGTRANNGQNLFHSFSNFSVGTGDIASFQNASDIVNIFSRVTGNSISNIDGIISANGTANLFLINPNGIIFSENASLSIGGSFFASTADTLLFEGNTEFSAINPQAPPLLEVSIPIGARFRDNPGNILNQSAVDGVGLQVNQGENIALIGGDVTFNNGIATASGGRVDLGGLNAAGEVSINSDGSLTFPGDVTKGDISIANNSLIDVRSTNSGNIFINSNKLDLLTSAFAAGILPGRTTENASAGDIVVNVDEQILLDSSFILNSINPGATGNPGNINITSNSLQITNGGSIFSWTQGNGNAGNIFIESELTSLDGNGFITASVAAGANGDGGDIVISGNNLTLNNGFQIQSRVREAENGFLAGQGDAGNVIVDIDGEVKLDGVSNNLSSQINTSVSPGAVGDSGEIKIEAEKISVSNGAFINATNGGQGNSGDITLDADGNIFVGGEGTVVVESPQGLIERSINSQVVNFVLPVFDLGEVEGNAGDINIKGESLNLVDGGLLSASVANGEGGNINIEVDDAIVIDGIGSLQQSGILNEIPINGVGNAGDIKITANSLSINNGGAITSSSFGNGTSGRIEIVADEKVSVSGFGSLNGQEISSQIFSIADTTGIGDANDINITTDVLELNNGGFINSETRRQGNAGNIFIKDATLVSLSQSAISSSVISGETPEGVAFIGEGQGGIIDIETDFLNLENSIIRTSSQGEPNVDSIGNAGNINLQINDSVNLNGQSNIISSVSFAEGNAGNITIQDTGSIKLREQSFIASFVSFAEGNAGNITIQDTGSIELSETSSVNSTIFNNGVGEGGNIKITSQSLSLMEGSQIAAALFREDSGFAGGKGSAGNISITSSDSINILGINQAGASSGIFASVERGSEGDGGDIIVNTSNLSVSDGAIINAQTFTESSGGNVFLNIDNLNVFGGGQITTLTRGNGNAGDVSIVANGEIILSGQDPQFEQRLGDFEEVVVNNPSGESGIFASALDGSDGTGGSVTISNPQQLTIADGATVTVSSPIGQAGNLNIATNSLFQNQGEINAETGSNTIIDGENIGANINLEISDTWIIENESIVSASAFGNAEGGNININQNSPDTEFSLFAFPPTGANGSDIIANAQNANGGRIEINAAGVFGIDFRDITANEARTNSLNDFTVSSEFGQSGETIINRTFEDPTSGLINLPASVGDASDQISQNPCQQGVGSQFIVTGKGGLPPNVNESLNSESARVGLIEPVEERLGDGETGGQGEIDNQVTEAVPAQGWVFNEKGEVTLTAYSTSGNQIQRSEQKDSSTCKI